MHKRIRLICVFLLVGITSILNAQSLTLQEVEEIVLKNNLQLLIGKKDVELSKQDFFNAIGSALPTISAYGQYTNNVELPVFIMDFDGPGGQPAQTIPMGAKYNSTFGISLTQPLFTGGAVLAGYNIAKEAVIITEQNRQITIDNTILAVRMFWYQIQLTNSLIAATEQGLTSAEANLNLTEKKLSAGTANNFEVLQARVSFESLKPQLIGLKNQQIILETNLIAYLNDPEINDITTCEKLIQENNDYKNVSIEELQNLAIQNRIEFSLLASQKKILLNQRNIAYGMTLPMVSLSADLRKQAQNEERDDMEYYQSKNVALNLSIPLFSGGKKFSDIQKSKIRLKQAELQRTLTENMIRTEVESYYLKVEESNKSIEANHHLVSQAQEALRLAKLMYKNGTSTQLEVQNAEAFVLQAQSAYYSSIFEYNVALNQLKKALHKL